VAPSVLSRAEIERIVGAIADGLDGDWVLVGGALAALTIDGRRTTEDVDVFGLQGVAEERYALMELAGSLGLPVEAVNSAADFFVRRIPDWKSELRVLRKGARATVHRPSATLFLLLKIARLSERDLYDCLGVLAAPFDPVDLPRVRAALAALPHSDDAALRARRAKLAGALG
jgi:hypothetical protein